MKRTSLWSAALSGACLLSVYAGSAQAAGFQLLEYSVTGLGRSYAGAGVVGDDYSALAFNPAGMGLKKTAGGQVGVVLMNIKSEVKGSINLSQDTSYSLTPYSNRTIVLNEAAPHFFTQLPVNEDITFGLGVYAPFGLSTNYRADWVGASHAKYSSIEGLDITPSLSYKVNDKWSVGVGVNFQRMYANLTNYPYLLGPLNNPLRTARSKVEGDDWGVGYNLGIMFEPVKDTRIGLSYRSKITHKLHGHHSMKVLGRTAAWGPGTAKVTTPESFMLSAYSKLNEKFGIAAMAKWTKWSRFDDLIIKSSLSSTPLVTKENWKNTWMASFGAEYYHSDKLTFRAGISYDETPINGAEYRTARIPDNNRIWLSAGLSYKYKNVTFDAGYTYMFVHDASARHEIDGTKLEMKYHTRANLFGFQVQYDF